MATYKGIQGYSVQTLASDPSPTASVEGQLWYNSTTSAYKIAVSGAGAWASAPAMANNRSQNALSGTQTAAIVAGAYGAPGNPLCESYNGSAWSEVADLNTGRYLQTGGGTSTAALSVAGLVSGAGSGIANVESWDGTSWAVSPVVNNARLNAGGCGLTSTAVLVFGGEGNNDKTESWNGTAWTELNDLNSGRQQNSGSGTSTSALTGGGDPTPLNAYVESWDGTCWTEKADLNTGKEGRMGAGESNTVGIITGGRSPYVANTEKWDGTSWTEVADLATARYKGSAVGTASTAILAGGSPGSPATEGSTTTEEWNDPVYAIKTVTTS